MTKTIPQGIFFLFSYIPAQEQENASIETWRLPSLPPSLPSYEYRFHLAKQRMMVLVRNTWQ